MYEYYMKKSEECWEKAFASTDIRLKFFYYNACRGFREKAENLKLNEVK